MDRIRDIFCVTRGLAPSWIAINSALCDVSVTPKRADAACISARITHAAFVMPYSLIISPTSAMDSVFVTTSISSTRGLASKALRLCARRAFRPKRQRACLHPSFCCFFPLQRSRAHKRPFAFGTLFAEKFLQQNPFQYPFPTITELLYEHCPKQ